MRWVPTHSPLFWTTRSVSSSMHEVIEILVGFHGHQVVAQEPGSLRSGRSAFVDHLNHLVALALSDPVRLMLMNIRSSPRWANRQVSSKVCALVQGAVRSRRCRADDGQ